MKYNIELDNENRIVNLIEFPFDHEKPYIEIDNYNDIILGKTTYINGQFGVHLNINFDIEKENKTILIKKEMSEIINWLYDNDYKINKFILGEYSSDSEKWMLYMEERNSKLKRYNEIENELKFYETF